MWIIAAFIFFRKGSFPANSHIIYQTYCISGHAASPQQMASAGAWQGVEKRGAYCNCQARSLESHSFLLHWSQSPYACSPSSPLSNFSCKTDWEIWGRCEKGKLLSLTLKPQLQTWSESWSKTTTSPKTFSGFSTERRDSWCMADLVRSQYNWRPSAYSCWTVIMSLRTP